MYMTKTTAPDATNPAASALAEILAEWVSAGWTPLSIRRVAHRLDDLRTAHYGGQHDAAPDPACSLGRCGSARTL